MAKRDNLGNLITKPDALKTLYLQTYSERLAHQAELSDVFELKTKLWFERLTILTKKEAPDWNEKHLLRVLTGPKNNKSIDLISSKHYCASSMNVFINRKYLNS